MQEDQSEKVVKYRWGPRNGYDGRQVAVMAVQLNLMSIPSEQLSCFK